MDAQELETHDLYYASYLQTVGLEMVRTEREGRRVFFVFSTDGHNIEQLKRGWINNTHKVGPLAYSHAIKNLKALVHEQ